MGVIVVVQDVVEAYVCCRQSGLALLHGTFNMGHWDNLMLAPH